MAPSVRQPLWPGTGTTCSVVAAQRPYYMHMALLRVRDGPISARVRPVQASPKKCHMHFLARYQFSTNLNQYNNRKKVFLDLYIIFTSSLHPRSLHYIMTEHLVLLVPLYGTVSLLPFVTLSLSLPLNQS